MKQFLNGKLVEMSDVEIAELNTKQPSDAKLLSHKWEGVRARRNNLLEQSDWVVTKAFETGVPINDDWKIYRQALRDVPLQSDVDNISWPTPPS